MKRRRGYTHQESVETLRSWIERKHKGSQASFIDSLSEKGIHITRAYVSDMLSGKRPPGPKFRQIFKEITGVTVVAGLVEPQEDDSE